ncbi:transposase [Undibacterium sp.]|uniref:transposase n=1 Tax=Undibacterium sp. TaxID=1914977 RepID=UPI0025EC5533|nr:transposase [Undibacterium sp.]
MLQSIEINDVLLSTTLDIPFDVPARILWIDRKNDHVVLMTIQNPPKRPWNYSWTVLCDACQSGQLTHIEVPEPEFMRVLESELSKKDKSLRDASWDLIKPLIETRYLGEIFWSDTMGKMVAERANAIAIEQSTPPDRTRLYRALYRYWLLGGVPNALLPNYPSSGARGKERKFINGKPAGRPPKTLGIISDVRAKILADEDKESIRIGYALFKNNDVKTTTDAYIRTLNKFYRANHPVPGFSDDEIILRPLAELPTLAQFQYWGKKAFDDITVLRKRKGERKWLMDHRSIVGRANDGLLGPCHRFEIDATIADIYLVSRFNRNWIIGRPVVYVVVDVFSRMIVGIFVGLEGPSWNGARQALLNAFTDKVAFCAAHGITINQQEWPCFHLPQEICADRGEMLGLAAEGLVTGLKINLAFPPPYRPDWKAIVESRFRILNQLTQVHWTPGGVAERVKERGQRDYRLDATLNLKEFTAIIISSVLHYNNFSEQPDWLNQEMIEQEISSTPMGIWNWGIEQGLGRPNIQSQERIRLHLMNKSSASVHAGGIYFSGMYYVAEDGADSLRYARARAKGREPIEVWHEPTKPEYLWIRNEDHSLRRCVLRDSESRYRDHRLEEIQDMLHIISHTSPAKRYAELTSQVKLDSDIQNTINQAVLDKATLDRPVSKAAQLGDIRSNRATERLAERMLSSTAPLTDATQDQPMAVMSSEQPSVLTGSETATEIFGDRGGEVIDFLSRLRKKQ